MLSLVYKTECSWRVLAVGTSGASLEGLECWVFCSSAVLKRQSKSHRGCDKGSMEVRL
jgi:hypothetical protein